MIEARANAPQPQIGVLDIMPGVLSGPFYGMTNRQNVGIHAYIDPTVVQVRKALPDGTRTAIAASLAIDIMAEYIAGDVHLVTLGPALELGPIYVMTDHVVETYERCKSLYGGSADLAFNTSMLVSQRLINLPDLKVVIRKSWHENNLERNKAGIHEGFQRFFGEYLRKDGTPRQALAKMASPAYASRVPRTYYKFDGPADDVGAVRTAVSDIMRRNPYFDTARAVAHLLQHTHGGAALVP